MCALFRPSILPSIFTSVRARDLVSATPPTSFIGFTWNFVDFLSMIWRCACGFRIWFNYFWRSYRPCWLKLCQPRSCLCNLSYIFHWIHLKFCRLLSMIWRCACVFRILVWLFLKELSPMLTLTCQPWSFLHNFFYIFHRIHFKLCRLPYCDMKMYTWFKIFDLIIFYGVIAHTDICF